MQPLCPLLGNSQLLPDEDGRQVIKEVSGGDAFSSQSQRAVHFGLKQKESIDRVEIIWPSGTVQTIQNPEVNKIHTIAEPRDV